MRRIPLPPTARPLPGNLIPERLPAIDVREAFFNSLLSFRYTRNRLCGRSETFLADFYARGFSTCSFDGQDLPLAL